jgi:hypothetical protein
VSTIDVGTPAAEANTMTKAIYDAFESRIGAPAIAAVTGLSAGIKGLSHSIASGIVSNIIATLSNGEILGKAGGALVGAAPAAVPDASTTVKGIVELATDGETASGVAVQGSDSRLAAATTTQRGTVELATSGEAAAGVAVQGNDARLAAATTTTSGIVELATSGEANAGVVVQGNDSRLAQATTSTRGTVELATNGEVAADVAVQGNDRRLEWPGLWLGVASAYSATAVALYATSLEPYINMPDGATTDVYWTFVVPPHYVSGNLNLSLHWICDTTEATNKDVRVLRNLRRFVAAELANALNATTTGTTTTVSGTIHSQEVYTVSTALDTSTAAGDVVRLRITRDGTNGADTYPGAMRLLGVLISP